MNQVVECESPLSPTPPPPTDPALKPLQDAALKTSYDALEAKSQLLRQSFVAQNQEGKRTGGTYDRHLRAYVSWWTDDQARLILADPSLQAIPALPITVAKVTLFLHYEMTRPQKRKLGDGTQSTSTCGIEHAKQVISALEHHRFNNQHLYRDHPEAQVSLRTDSRIKTLESVFAHNEPERTKKAHTLKAAGTRADTYDDSQLSKMAISGMLDSKGPMTIWRAMRDRAMLLTSSSLAFRGDSSRSLLWSDMYCYDVPMNAKGRGQKLRALTLIADGSKQNQTGRVDEHGAFRHLCVELCPVGGMAFLFFAHFHVNNAAVPDFSIDFSDPEYGEYGKRDWYELFTFSTSKDCKREMQYATHRERVKGLYEKNDISISKVTHAGRGYTAKTAREHGANATDVKALGGWSDSGSYRACYDRALPVPALLAAAMFDGEHPESHFLARDALEPPAEVLNTIFPWIEKELDELAERELANRRSRDIALRHFLGLLIWFRTILVQDAAVLYARHPAAQIFQYPPFNSTPFREFALRSTAIIAKAEKDVAMALEKLPEHIASTFTATMARLAIDQQLERDSSKLHQEEMKAQLALLQGLVEDGGRAGGSKRRKVSHSVIPPPTAELSPPMTIPRETVYPSDAPTASKTNSSASPSPLADIVNTPVVPSATASPTPAAGQPQFMPAQLAAIQYIRGPLPLPKPVPVAVPVASPALNSSLSRAAPPAQTLAANGATLVLSDMQLSVWNELASKYGDKRLRRHQWEWIDKSSRYLPYYEHQTPSKISDIWVEWVDGLNGYLSTRELEEGWGTAWRRNIKKIQTERCRRSKVIDLITRLAAKRNWSLDLALNFIRERCELARESNGKLRFPTVRAFCDFLQKTRPAGEMSGVDMIIFESNSYTR